VLNGCAVQNGAAHGESIESYCFNKYPESREQIALCIDQQNETRLHFQNILHQYGIRRKTLVKQAARGNVVAQKARYCQQRWLPNHQMAVSCLKQQIKAAKKSGKIR
jgi:hypothetical protein